MFETVLHRDSEYRPALDAPVLHAADTAGLFGSVLHEGRRPSAPVVWSFRVQVAPPAFEGVRRRDLGARSGRRVAWTSASTIFQLLVVLGIMALATGAARQVTDEPLAPVRVVAVKVAPPPPPPPAAPPTVIKRSRPLPPDAKVVKAPPPGALVQPKEVQEEMKTPEKDEPYEELPAAGDGAEGGEGVIGGVVAPPPAQEPAKQEIEEAPRWMTTGFKRPVEAEPGCVGRSVRLPRELLGFVSGTVSVKFAVLSSGQVDRIEVMTKLPDGRINEAIASAVRSCKFAPGADAAGRPTAIWVILPLRFTAL